MLVVGYDVSPLHAINQLFKATLGKQVITIKKHPAVCVVENVECGVGPNVEQERVFVETLKMTL